MRELLGEHEVAEVVAALAAVGLRHRQAEEAELAHAPEDRVRERRLLPLLRVRRELACITKAWIDSRSASCSSVKMKWRRGAAWSGLRTSVAAIAGAYALRIGSTADGFALAIRRRRTASPRSRSTSPRRATRSRTSCSTSCSRRSRARATTTTSAASCSPPRTRRSSRRAATSRASRPSARSCTSTSPPSASRGCSRPIGELGKPTLCAANGHVLAGALGLALGLRPDRRQGGRPLRHARDQRRGLPVHDHGADLPQRRAQEDQRAAAARRADRRRTRRSGSGSSTRSCRRRVRRRGRRLGGPARGQVAAADAAGQGRDVPPAGHGAAPTRSSTCTRSSALAFSTDDIQEGVKAFFEKREPVWTGQLSVVALRCRTSDRTPGGARGAEALALALDPDARMVGTLGEPRVADWDDDLRDSHGCLLEAGGQVEDMLGGGRFPVLTRSDCSICLTTFQAVARLVPGRARAVAGRARRLQHARHDAERLPRRHVPGGGLRRVSGASRPARRAGHSQHGRPEELPADHLLDVRHRLAGAGRLPAAWPASSARTSCCSRPSPKATPILWVMGALTSLLTAIYMGRLVFLTF